MSELILNYGLDLKNGLLVTLSASVLTLIISFIFGVLLAMGRLSDKRITNILSTVYIEFFKNIPLLVVAMFFFIVVPMYFVQINGYTAGIIGLTLYTSAFVAETIRTGIQSIPTGQTEAAISTGLSRWETMREIVLPQAIRIILPALGNQFVDMIKNSSILAMVAGGDLMYQADLIASSSFLTMETYFLIGLMYLLLTLPLSYFMKYLEYQMVIEKPKELKRKLFRFKPLELPKKEREHYESVTSLFLD